MWITRGSCSVGKGPGGTNQEEIYRECLTQEDGENMWEPMVRGNSPHKMWGTYDEGELSPENVGNLWMRGNCRENMWEPMDEGGLSREYVGNLWMRGNCRENMWEPMDEGGLSREYVGTYG